MNLTNSTLYCLLGVVWTLQVFGLGTATNSQDIPKSYTGYKLLRTGKFTDSKAAEALIRRFEREPDVHFFRYPRRNLSSDILASPELFPKVQSLLSNLGLGHEVLSHDIDQVLNAENATIGKVDLTVRQANVGPALTWTSYPNYKDIVNFCKTLRNKARRGVKVTWKSIGKSYENRDIILVKMFSGNNKVTKPAIFVDGGMHAREWISTTTATYIMNILATDESRGSELLKKFDWYFVPVINVDGYEYTHTNDRMWRKTRSRDGKSRTCCGADPNRNYVFKFGGEGTSSDACSDMYKGSSAFSEKETRAHSNFILENRHQIKMYLTLHSFSQMFLVPWGYAYEKPSDYDELYNLALKGKTALEKTYDTKYEVGNSADLMYPAAGASDDWAKSVGIKFSYTVELRDTGKFGFMVPASQIKPTGEETFNAVKAMAIGLNEILEGK